MFYLGSLLSNVLRLLFENTEFSATGFIAIILLAARACLAEMLQSITELS